MNSMLNRLPYGGPLNIAGPKIWPSGWVVRRNDMEKGLMPPVPDQALASFWPAG
jgi:hypothetical protein